MIDNHVHVGWFTDGYHSPKEVWKSEIDAGIDEIVVSSTSTCAELYKQIVREMNELIRLGGSRIHPILWLTPRMMKTWGIRHMLKSKIRWQGVKMHWFAHHEWFYNRHLTNEALHVAKKLKVPVLFHTGVDKVCNPNAFVPIIVDNPDLSFVLAHGRPLEDTFYVLKKFPNTLVDTAFMPIEDVKQLCDAGFEKRILFGTDAPINRLFYENLSTTDYISNCLAQLQETLSQKQYEQIMSNKIYT